MDQHVRAKFEASLTVVQPLHLVVGALFAFLISFALDALDRPLVAAAFGTLALATVGIVPLQAALSARSVRVRYFSVVNFVVGATVAVLLVR
jgi:hypothetical protein